MEKTIAQFGSSQAFSGKFRFCRSKSSRNDAKKRVLASRVFCAQVVFTDIAGHVLFVGTWLIFCSKAESLSVRFPVRARTKGCICEYVLRGLGRCWRCEVQPIIVLISDYVVIDMD
jgi:hypothetical protein